jgi:NitT/TauT family transport system substrate-binding protein
MKYRRLLSILTGAALLVGAKGALPAPVRAGPSYNLIMNWFPEPEEGGYYTAQRLGLYQKAGITSSINEFSYGIHSTVPLVIAGRAAFGMANADELLQYQARGANVVAIMTTFQINPVGILWHAEDTSIKTLADLGNHKLIYRFGAAFEPYLVQKYHYANFTTGEYDFTSRGFALDAKAVNQCYVTSEPYVWGQQGIKVKYALIASTGYDPYGDVIFTTREMIAKHPEVVRAYIKASIEGWNDYLTNTAQAAATNKDIQSEPGSKVYVLTTNQINFSYSQVLKLKLVNSGDALTHGIGYLSQARWKTLQRQMVGTGQKVGGVDVSMIYSDQFLPSSQSH